MNLPKFPCLPIDLQVGMAIDNCELLEDHGCRWWCHRSCCAKGDRHIFVAVWKLCNGKGKLCHSCVAKGSYVLPIGYIGINGKKVLEQNSMDPNKYKMECTYCGDVRWANKSYIDNLCYRCGHRLSLPETFGEFTILRIDFRFRHRVICQCSCGNEESIFVWHIKNGKRLRCQICIRTKYIPERSFSRILGRVCWVINTRPHLVYLPWLQNPERFAEYLTLLEWWDNPVLDISRIDETQGYEPGNIRFETHIENCLNRRPSLALREHFTKEKQDVGIIA